MGWSKNHGNIAKVNADYAKAQAEIAKQEASNLAELKTNAEVAAENANTATADTIAVIEDANTAASNADNAASEAATQASYAKNQAERAKSEADRLVGTDVSVLDNKVTIISQKVDTEIGKVTQQLDETNRQTQTLQHGSNVINGTIGSPLDVQIQGRTLISLGNSTLDSTKKYVLADKKIKIKWADASVLTGTAKFIGRNERPTIIRIANFENKVTGSTAENPHDIYYSIGSTLMTPLNGSLLIDQVAINVMTKIDGAISIETTKINGGIAQRRFTFNLIAEVERQIGRIPRSTLADRVQWLKENIESFTANWYGFGSGVGGNKAVIQAWRSDLNAWNATTFQHTQGTVAKLTHSSRNVAQYVDSNGLFHLLANSNQSDGVTSSTINTDYVELEIELKPSANFTQPNVPLYEVAQSDYDNILVVWDENKVLNLYPKVEGVQHLTNPYLIIGGANPSYLYLNLKLGQVGNQKDTLKKIDGKWILNKLVDTEATTPVLLTTPQTIDVTDKVEGDLVVNGLTQVNVGSGFTFTTDDKGKRIYTLTPANQRYLLTVNATELIATYSKNIRTALDDTINKQSDIATTLSVHERAIVDLYVRIKALEVK